jgi:hypothetical protein
LLSNIAEAKSFASKGGEERSLQLSFGEFQSAIFSRKKKNKINKKEGETAMNFRVLGGSVIGRSHSRIWLNNQDSFRIGEGSIGEKHYHFGVICDGCTAGSANEVGANLLATYVCSEIPMILMAGVSIRDLPSALFMRCIGYLRSIASQTVMGNPQTMIEFIKNHLLCTVMGFVMDDDDCLIFSAGDGAVYFNGQLRRIDQNNQPMYPAYHLVDRAYLNLQGVELPQSFQVVNFKTAEIQRLAICSDGIIPEVIEGAWGHEKSLFLQRALKGFCRRLIDLQDDCTVITIERLAAENSAALIKTPEGSRT